MKEILSENRLKVLMGTQHPNIECDRSAPLTMKESISDNRLKMFMGTHPKKSTRICKATAQACLPWRRACWTPGWRCWWGPSTQIWNATAQPGYREGEHVGHQVEDVDGDPAQEYVMRLLRPAYREGERVGHQVEDVDENQAHKYETQPAQAHLPWRRHVGH